MGFNVLVVSPAVELHDEMERQSTSTQQHHQEGDQPARDIVAAADLKLKIPSYDDKDLDDGSSGDACRTPTSRDQKIPSCPPAPKKPKAIPSCRKRKSRVVTGNILDLSQEIESLFPAPLLLDLYGKINKVRRGN
ncbi:hypothetical protein QN277_003070 [Acacia crassicarpa]|uniref:Uncharacterized protein n=1 Tax=Acacia crassicarpa TaxID=499986 RepID=A0AAE1NC77_9FABA|nr:hypothetical protein QN277_003070 [Acacia crassicarpa]